MIHDIMSAVITERLYNCETTPREASGQAVTLFSVLSPKIVAYGVNVGQSSTICRLRGALLRTGGGIFGLFLDMLLVAGRIM
jgi:hypothetical protein